MKQIAELAVAEHTVLWLLDQSWGAPRLLPSYYTGKNTDAPKRLKNEDCEISDIEQDALSRGDLSEDLELRLRIQLEDAELDPDEFNFEILFASDFTENGPAYASNSQILGIIGCGGSVEKLNMENSKRLLEDLSNQIELSRLHRFAHAVTATQSFFSEVENDVDQSLMQIGHMVKSEISAKRFVYRNENTSAQWLEVSDTNKELLTFPQDIQFNKQDDPTKFGEIQKRLAVLRSLDQEDQSVELVVVPFLQPSYQLSRLSFTNASEFLGKLTKSKSNDINLIFLEKSTNEYLQSCFSDTDLLVAGSVFGYIEKYTSAKIFDENSSKILHFLKDAPRKEIELTSIFATLQSLSTRFTDLKALTFHNVQSEIETNEEDGGGKVKLGTEYLSRLKQNYLSKFFSSNTMLSSDEPFFGLDGNNEEYRLEVHFPSSSGSSKIFVATYVHNEISESIARSFVNLFSEIYARVKKEENLTDRANYLMQVRHAVIHHFSAANRSIKSIKPLWDRGQRNKEYWVSLLDDPVVEDEFSRALTSLGQANLIIENGRFLLGEIDPKTLNRKPYKFVDVVQNCLQILQDIREEKRIRISSKVTGSPPKIMNADEPLLNIAVMNLFDNALKYSPYFKTVKWAIDYRNDHFRFEITSVGDLLDRSKKDLLFQVGFRGSQRDKLNQRHGTGLGLPVAYKILKAHSLNAELDLYPEPNNEELGGDTNSFYFEMPYLTGQSSGRDEEKSEK